MKNKLSIVMSMAILSGFAVLMLMNIGAMFGLVPSRYLSPNDVKGAGVQYKQVIYTLNFEQQNALVEMINRSQPLSKEALQKRKSTSSSHSQIEKIIIYQFNRPAIEITPIAYLATSSLQQKDDAFSTKFVYSSPEWNAEGYLEEDSSGEFHKLLLTAYNH